MVHIKTNKHNLKYYVRVSREVVDDATEWCEENCGSQYDTLLNHPDMNHNGTWTKFWAGLFNDDEQTEPLYDFSFKHEKDAILFSLRWS
jgi:hypothetical protein